MAPWIPIAKQLPPEFAPIDVWLQIYASPRSMGMSDSFRVVDAWRKGDKWYHRDRGVEAELYSDYVTHWMAAPKPPRQLRQPAVAGRKDGK